MQRGEPQLSLNQVKNFKFAPLSCWDPLSTTCVACQGLGEDINGLCTACDGHGLCSDYEPHDVNVQRMELWHQSGDCAFLLENLLSPEECDDIIAQSEAFGLRSCEYDNSFRITDRVSVNACSLGDVLYERARPYLGDVVVQGNSKPLGIRKDLYNGRWQPKCLNQCFRICRYSPGGFFLPHFDMGWDDCNGLRSIKTFMVYLNDDFSGGDTSFFNEQQVHYRFPKRTNRTYALRPKKGSCLVFNHSITHDGGKLFTGTKYILRTEVMYTNAKERVDCQCSVN